ncbi:hypothetical protein ACFQ68_07025 [Amycolatopsis japonica]|uniref:hypothetical protein n=1 Tax=Amycolatopsis japonica TaxID=208439 RepID=UPI003672D951
MSRWLGLTAIVLVLLVVHLIVVSRDRTVPALAVARDVGTMQPIADADLVAIDLVPEHGVRFVPADERRVVLGRKPAFGLLKGTLLTSTSLKPEGAPEADTQVVGLRVGPGHRPSQELWHGAYVCVSPLPAVPSCDASSTGEGAFRARIAAVGTPEPGGAVVVDLLVDRETIRFALAAAGSGAILSLIGV